MILLKSIKLGNDPYEGKHLCEILSDPINLSRDWTNSIITLIIYNVYPAICESKKVLDVISEKNLKQGFLKIQYINNIRMLEFQSLADINI